MTNLRQPLGAAAAWVLAGALGLSGTATADEQWLRAMKGARDALHSGEMAEARRWLDTATRRLRTFGEGDWRRAGTAQLAGSVALVQGDLDTAARALDEAAGTYRSLFGNNSAPLLFNGVEQGHLALARGDLPAARAAFEAVLAAAEAAPDANAATIASAHLGLGEAGLLTGDPSYQRHLEQAADAAAGSPRRATEVSLARATIAARLGRIDEARERVTEARSKVTGAQGEAFLTASCDYVDGMLSLARQSATRAVTELGSAVTGWEDSGVRDHPALARALAALAAAHFATGNTREADAAMQRAVAMAPRAVDDTHPLRDEIALAAAALAASTGEADVALGLARPLLTSSLGAADRARAATLVANAAGDAEASAEAIRTLSEIDSASLPPGSAAVVQEALAEALLASGQVEAALEAAIGGIERLRSADRTGHPAYVRMEVRAAALHELMGRTAAAAPHVRAALDAVRATGERSAPAVFALLAGARLADAEERPDEAARQLESALSTAEAAAGNTSLLYAVVQREAGLRAARAGADSSALTIIATALASARKALPARHPALLDFWLAQLDVQLATGRVRDAAASLRSAATLGSLAGVVGSIELARRGAAVELAQNRVEDADKRLQAASMQAAAMPVGGLRTRLTFEIAEDRAQLEAHRGNTSGALAALPDSMPDSPLLAERWAVESARLATGSGSRTAAAQRVEQALTVVQTGGTGASPDRLLAARAGILAASGQPTAALDLQRRSVDAAVTAFGENHLRVARARLGLARAQRRTGRYADAVTTLDQVTAFFQAAGQNDEAPAVALLEERAALAAELADFPAADEALATAQRALEKSMRAEHPALASLALARIDLQVAAGNWTEAQNQLTRFSAQVARRLAADHPVRVRTLILGARLALARGQVAAANSEIEQAIAATSTRAADDPQRIAAIETMAEAALDAGDPNGALTTLESLPGPVSVARVALLARSHVALGAAAHAADLIRTTLASLQGGAQRLDAIALLLVLADAQTAAREPAGAETSLRDARTGVGTVDDRHPLGIAIDVQLASVLLEAGRVVEAASAAEAARQTAADRLGEEHPAFALAVAAHGRVLAAQGRLADAVTALKLAQTIQERTLGAGHPETAATVHDLVDVLTANSQLDEAATLLSRTVSAVSRLNGGRTPAAIADRFAVQGAWLRLAQGQPRAAREAFGALLESPSASTRAQAGAGAALAALRLRNVGDAAEVASAVNGDQSERAGWLAAAIAATAHGIRDRNASPAAAFAQIDEQARAARGADHPDVIALQCTLGDLASGAGETALGIRFLEQCRNSAAATLDSTHPLVQLASIRLVHERLQGGDVEGAAAELAALEESGPAGESAGAARDVARAALLRVEGDSGAVEALESAIAVTERLLGARHPTHAQRVVRLGSALIAAGRAGEAEPMLRRALGVLEQALGKTHPALSGVLGELGRASLALGRTSGATAYHRRQVALLENAYGPQDARLLAPLTALATLEARAGQVDAALAGLTRARDISRSLANQPIAAADASTRLADTLLAAGRHEEALGHYEDALRTYDTSLAPDDTRLARTLRSLAALSLMLGRTDAAADFLARAGTSG